MHTIRQATLNDLPVLRHLWLLSVLTETYPEDQGEDTDQATRQLGAMLAAPEPPGYAFLAEVSGAPVGMLLYLVCHRAIGSPHRYAFCSNLYVDPGHRHQGIAGDLCEIAATHALSQGLTSIELNAQPGHPFHPALGHTVVSHRMQTTPTKLIAALDRRRERHPHANGLDQDAPLTAPDVPEKD